MAIERRLTEIVGPLGGKLHTGRSRNDQVATDLALYVGERCGVAIDSLTSVLGTLHELASATATGGCPATPTCSAPSRSRSDITCSPGSGCCAATSTASRPQAGRPHDAPGNRRPRRFNWELDREATAAELGFEDVHENSIDAVSNRDFALDYLRPRHLRHSPVADRREIVLWSTTEFGFCRPAEDYSSGSSIMPQKMNPDAAELLRAKAPRVAASFATVNGVLHGLPLAYSKDLQEDKEALFDAVDTIELCLSALDGMLGGITFDREAMADAAADEMAAATDVADLLVRRGMPFREAHGVVGGLVRHALEQGIALSEIPASELGLFSELLDDEYYEVLAEDAWLDSKVSRGGTSADAVRRQLVLAAESLDSLRG